MKKGIVFVLIFFAAVADICIYRNQWLYNRAKKMTNLADKARILEKASGGIFSNESVYFELGNAYFDLGMLNLEDRNRSLSFFQKSAESYNRSIAMNPASPFVHFLFARTLAHMEYFKESRWPRSFTEYKKAARLTGHHSQIHYDVIQVFLYRWKSLDDNEKRFAVNTLRDVLKEGWRGKLNTVLQIWDLTVRDEEILRSVLPVNANVYREAARFLGERSHPVPFRHELLVGAENLDFDEVQSLHDMGVREYQYYQIDEAVAHFLSALNIIKRIRFYDIFQDEEVIDRIKYKNLKRSLHLNLAKCLIEQGKGLESVSPHVMSYLDLTNQQHEISELISYLESRRFIPEKLDPDFKDLDRLAFQIHLYFKNNRYRDIVSLGNLMGKSLVVVSDQKKEEYVEILLLLGESYQKVDYIFEAARFLEVAFEADKNNLKTLLNLRDNYKFLNMSDKLQEVNAQIEKLVFPGEMDYKKRIIKKRRNFVQKMLFEGEKKVFHIEFKSEDLNETPLVSICFNGMVAWEDYIEDGKVTLVLDTIQGENILEINSVNIPVELEKISVYQSAENVSSN
ncbi:MAG: hypothetical protein JXB26_03435 [Candidatus Aminicenantes bacterium]|nr:hypothetical protein [Candidatus Aminicenantes bacterium]